MKCSMCENTKTLATSSVTHKYKECGLDSVILHGVKVSKCENCGETYFNFGNVDKLHQLIASYLVKKSDILTGQEIRFLRKYLGYSGTVFAGLVGYEVEHLSRLENGKSPISETFDRLVRTLVMEKIPSRDYSLHDLFIEGKAIKISWLEFSRSGKIWKFKKSA